MVVKCTTDSGEVHCRIVRMVVKCITSGVPSIRSAIVSCLWEWSVCFKRSAWKWSRKSITVVLKPVETLHAASTSSFRPFESWSWSPGSTTALAVEGSCLIISIRRKHIATKPIVFVFPPHISNLRYWIYIEAIVSWNAGLNFGSIPGIPGTISTIFSSKSESSKSETW